MQISSISVELELMSPDSLKMNMTYSLQTIIANGSLHPQPTKVTYQPGPSVTFCEK